MVEGISRDELQGIILAAAKEAVRQNNAEFYAILGISLDNQVHRDAIRDDFIWVRRSRRLSENIGGKVWSAIIGAAVLAAFMALLAGVWYFVNKGPP